MWEKINLKNNEEALFIHSCGYAIRRLGEDYVVPPDHLDISKQLLRNWRENKAKEDRKRNR